MTDEQVCESGPTTRRALLMGAGAAGAVAVLAACGTDPDADSADSGTNAGTTAPGGAATGSADSGGSGATALANTADIPVEGGKIFEEPGVVVTQPTEDDFKAFTNICTHQNCPVADVDGGTINCACHGSKFSIEDGSVIKGPAKKALEAKGITVEGGKITLT